MSFLTAQERKSLREVAAITEALFNNPATLIERATDVLARIQRVALKVGPEGRLLLQQELALVGTLLDKIEFTVCQAAKGEVKQLPTARKALPPFRGGRIWKGRVTA
jgi:hypothetical protein